MPPTVAQRVFAVCAALVLLLLTAPPVSAVEPPAIDPAAVPPDVTGPEQPYEQRRLCSQPLTTPGASFTAPPWANRYLGVDRAQRLATGVGITVALIDTGVTASPRVPADPGGDFVTDGDGLFDCDAHGTLVASLIAGRPSGTDGFVGVAPDAKLISLRQSSAAYDPVDNSADEGEGNASSAAGTVRSLARAVVRAANLGAKVINISEAACFKANSPVDEASLGAALNYAVNAKGAAVVVAAGNTGGDCAQNPPPDPSTPNDPRGWQQVQTIVTPAWFSGLVLTVGSVGENGQPSPFSMNGPWLGVAAPGENIVALGLTGAPVDALPGKEGPVPIAGTSFAAAYVSGIAALLWQRFPEFTPAQIIARITESARHPGGGVNESVGAGVVDAFAALTWGLPPAAPEGPAPVRQVEPPTAVPPADRGPISAVSAGIAVLLVALGLAALTKRALSRR